MTTGADWTKHRPLARAVAGEFYVPGAGRDDVEQEALIGLWVAARTFDRERNASFPSFARLVIRRRLSSILKAALREKHMVLTGAARDEVQIEGGTEPDRVVIARDRLQRLVVAVSELSPLERAAVAHVSSGHAYRHDKQIDNAITRARKKLREVA